MKQGAASLLAALWWGGLTAVGLVVPLLFANLPATTAGQMAAQLFSAQSLCALVLGVALVLLLNPPKASETSNFDENNPGVAVFWSFDAISLVVTGMLLAALLEFAVAPRIAAKVDLTLWHSLGSAMLLAQWACAGALLWRLSGSRHG